MAEANTTHPSLSAKAIYYNVLYDCANCDWRGVRIFGKGITAPETALCPKCDCRTANKRIAPPCAPRRQAEPVEPCPPTPFSPWRPYYEKVNYEIGT